MDDADDVDESDDADADDGDDDGDDGDADADDREVFEIVGILEETFELAGGTVTILVRESEIILLEGDPAEGWELDVERIAGREARVEFGCDGERSRFKADLAGGRLLLRIDLLRADEADDDVDDADDPRDVFEIDGRFERTFELTGGDVMIIATESSMCSASPVARREWSSHATASTAASRRNSRAGACWSGLTSWSRTKRKRPMTATTPMTSQVRRAARAWLSRMRGSSPFATAGAASLM